MQEVTTTTFAFPSTGQDVLTAILRQGAQQMLTTAIEAEVAEWIESHRHLADERGHRQVVRNGYLPERTIITGVGPVKVQQPRVHDRRTGEEREALLLEDSAALLAKDEEPRGADSLAVPQGDQHGRLQRSAGSAGGPGVPRPVGFDDHAATRPVARRIPGVVEAVFEDKHYV